jgi:hypothetical protein
MELPSCSRQAYWRMRLRRHRNKNHTKYERYWLEYPGVLAPLGYWNTACVCTVRHSWSVCIHLHACVQMHWSLCPQFVALACFSRRDRILKAWVHAWGTTVITCLPVRNKRLVSISRNGAGTALPIVEAVRLSLVSIHVAKLRRNTCRDTGFCCGWFIIYHWVLLLRSKPRCCSRPRSKGFAIILDSNWNEVERHRLRFVPVPGNFKFICSSSCGWIGHQANMRSSSLGEKPESPTSSVVVDCSQLAHVAVLVFTYRGDKASAVTHSEC